MDVQQSKQLIQELISILEAEIKGSQHYVWRTMINNINLVLGVAAQETAMFKSRAEAAEKKIQELEAANEVDNVTEIKKKKAAK